MTSRQKLNTTKETNKIGQTEVETGHLVDGSQSKIINLSDSICIFTDHYILDYSVLSIMKETAKQLNKIWSNTTNKTNKYIPLTYTFHFTYKIRRFLLNLKRIKMC